MSANESESESNEKGQLDKDKPDFESRTKAAKKISWNKEGKNKLKGIYKERSISSARKQKLAAKKLEKKYLKLTILKHFGNVIVT